MAEEIDDAFGGGDDGLGASEFATRLKAPLLVLLSRRSGEWKDHTYQRNCERIRCGSGRGCDQSDVHAAAQLWRESG